LRLIGRFAAYPDAPLIAELAFFMAKIIHPLLNFAPSKQKLFSVRLLGLAAAHAAKSGA
jgi:hypothetical protein